MVRRSLRYPGIRPLKGDKRDSGTSNALDVLASLAAVSALANCSIRRGALHFQADYIRGRRVKTDITVRSDGSVTVTTVGRGRAPLRWLDRLKGKKAMRIVGNERQDPP